MTATTTLAGRIRQLKDTDIAALHVLYAYPSLTAFNIGLLRAGFLYGSGRLNDVGRAAASLTLEGCAWCGAECRMPWQNRRDETFCSRSHRHQSNAALARLIEKDSSSPAE